MERVARIYRKLTIVLFCAGEFFFYPLYAVPVLSVDYYTYKSAEEGKTHLEFYSSIENSKIQFISDGTNFSASVSATLYLFNNQDRLIKKQVLDYNINCNTYDETLNPFIKHYFKFVLNIEPAIYKAVLVIDDNNISTQIKQEEILSIPDYWSTFSLSSLQIFTSSEEQNKVPNIEHFIFYTMPQVEVYYESYNFNNTSNLQNLEVEYQIKNKSGNVVTKHSETISKVQNNSGFKTTFPIGHLASGEYSLHVKQVVNKKQASSNIYFTVVQSPTNLALKLFSQALDELQYIATSEELDNLKSLTIDKRQKGFDKFWNKFDPTPETPKNELMIEYYKRINQANKTFSRRRTSGYETDFGMIFMLFGKPDKVVVNEQQTKVWFYKNLGRSFTFVGLNKFSAYNLVGKGQIYAEYMPR